MKAARFPMFLGGTVATLLSLSAAASADLVPPPSPLAGNSNYWITAAPPDADAGVPITGLNVAVAVTQDLNMPNGMSIQLNGWSAPTSNVVWQQYGFSVVWPTLGWGIENWPTMAYGASLGLPSGGSLNFPGSLEPSLPGIPYGTGIVPAGYVFDIVFHDDANGNITGTTYDVTDICGNLSSIGPVNIVGTSLSASGVASGTIPESALAPMYGIQMNMVNEPGNPFVFNAGAGTITFSANELLYVSNHQPSWTSAQGIVTGENSSIAYSELSSTPSKVIVQDFGSAQCQCDTSGGSACAVPTGSYLDSCTGCTSTASGSGCLLSCTSCGTIGGTQNANPSVQLPCTGTLTNASISNSNGNLQLQCSFVPSADAGIATSVDAGCSASACVTPDGPYLGSCTGCAAISAGSGCVLTCTACADGDGGEDTTPNLPLPCSGSIIDDNGVLSCFTGTSDDGGNDGSANEPDGSTGEKDAGTGSKDGGAGVDAGKGGGTGEDASASDDGGASIPGLPSSGCGCSLAGRQTRSPVQGFVALGIGAVIWFGRRRKRRA